MKATNSPAVGGGSTSRRGLIPANCWRDSINAALTTAGALGGLLFAWFVLRGLAALTYPLGLLLLHVAAGRHL